MPRKGKPRPISSGCSRHVYRPPLCPRPSPSCGCLEGEGLSKHHRDFELLLTYWFKTDHRLPDGHRFRYHYFQQEAIETLIYLYEAVKVRSHKALLEGYAPPVAGIRLLRHDDFARYAVKMATGSGKTKVMSLVIAWQYLNATAEGLADYAKTFLILAPNVIVFERLRSDFAGARVFRRTRSSHQTLRSSGMSSPTFAETPNGPTQRVRIYLTNIQQLYTGTSAGDSSDEPDEMSLVLGNKPVFGDESDRFRERIAARGSPCLVINDEGHHTHDEDNEWNAVIREVHSQPGADIRAQIDFSATPRYPDGWTLHVDGIRLPIEAGDHRQRRQAAHEGHNRRTQGPAFVRCQRPVHGPHHGWR